MDFPSASLPLCTGLPCGGFFSTGVTPYESPPSLRLDGLPITLPLHLDGPSCLQTLGVASAQPWVELGLSPRAPTPWGKAWHSCPLGFLGSKGRRERGSGLLLSPGWGCHSVPCSLQHRSADMRRVGAHQAQPSFTEAEIRLVEEVGHIPWLPPGPSLTLGGLESLQTQKPNSHEP